MKIIRYFGILLLITLVPLRSLAGDNDGAIESRLNDLEKRISALEQNPTKASKQSKTKGTSQTSAGWKNKSNWRSLKMGMSESDVLNLLGEAGKVDSFSFGVTWYYDYPSGGYVVFDANSMVVNGWKER